MTVQPHTLQQSKLVQRSPIFYGWVVWFVATIGLSATAPGQSFSVSLFIDHYITDFGLDRTSVSALYGLGTFLAALSLTWVGRRIDRHGNRLMSVFIALVTAGFILVAGWLVDRLRPGLVVMIQMLGLIAACVLAMIMTSPALLFVYTAAYGVFMGLGSVFDGTVWVNLFGRQHQGAIRGFVATTGVMGTSIGPIIFGLSYDYLDSYAPALWLGVSLSVIALVLALIVKAPVRRTAA